MARKPNLQCVTNLAGAKAERMDDKDAPQHIRLPSAYLKLRNLALEDLHQFVGAMFEQTDDVFFGLAEKAESNQAQEEHMAAMREVRLSRKNIERKFYKYVANLFKEFPDPLSPLNEPVMEAITSMDQLSIMQHDEVEENVAVETMVVRANSENASNLRHLVQRLDVLAMNVTVSATNIPLAPKHLCDAFRDAISELTCAIAYKLVVYKLFERHVLNNFHQVLNHCNQLLIGAGILTDLPELPQQAASQPSSASKSRASTVQNVPLTGENEGGPDQDSNAVGAVNSQGGADQQANVLAGQLYDLMASLRGATCSIGKTNVSNPVIGSTSPGAKSIGIQDLVSVLSGIQSVEGGAQNNNSDSFAGAALSGLLSNRIQARSEQKGPEKVAEVDSDVINFVSMLFEFILDDDSLPTQIKVLIGRLQIPLVKVAMLDKAFFATSGHPARKLLNALAKAGIGLSGIKLHLAKDPVYAKIHAVVHRVVEEFTDNVELFEELDNEFSEFMDVEVRRSVLIEQRTKTAEEGRAKSDVAKDDVAKVIKDCIGNVIVPPVVTKILSDPWSKILYLSHIKEGAESRDFQKKVFVVKYLVKSVTPPQNAKERKYLYDMVPMLEKRLQEGFDSISYNPFDGNELLAGLKSVQMDVIREKAADTIDQDSETSGAVDSLLEAISSDIQQIGDVSRKTPEPKDVVSLDITKKPSGSGADKKTVTVEMPQLPDDDEDFAKAKAIGVGSWVNINDDPGKGPESAVRCKLAAYIKSADRMIFVNRSGIKVAEHSLLALAYAFKQKTITIIDDALLFDKALENVIGSLRKVRQASL